MYNLAPNTYFSGFSLIGVDASKTLQGQLTNDVENIKNGRGIKALLCNIKGRVEVIVWLVKHDSQHFTLLVPTDNAGTLTGRLAPYLAFSKSALVPLDLSNHSIAYPYQIVAPQDTITSYQMDDIALMAPEHLKQTQEACPASIETFHSHRVQAGLLQLLPEQSGVYTPQALSLDHLGYISFNKGCYMGQEIIARLHYKGQSKHQLALLSGAQNITSEAVIQSELGDPIGTIVDATSASSGLYLASIRTDATASLTYRVQEHSLILIRLFNK